MTNGAEKLGSAKIRGDVKAYFGVSKACWVVSVHWMVCFLVRAVGGAARKL